MLNYDSLVPSSMSTYYSSDCPTQLLESRQMRFWIATRKGCCTSGSTTVSCESLVTCTDGLDEHTQQKVVEVVRSIELHPLHKRQNPRLRSIPVTSCCVRLDSAGWRRQDDLTSWVRLQPQGATSTLYRKGDLVITREDWMSSLPAPEVGALTPFIREKPAAPALQHGS